jgi:hypothetical protein
MYEFVVSPSNWRSLSVFSTHADFVTAASGAAMQALRELISQRECIQQLVPN